MKITDLEKMYNLSNKELNRIIIPSINEFDDVKLKISAEDNYSTMLKIYKFQFEYFLTLENIDLELKNKLNLRLLEINAYIYGWDSGEYRWLQRKTVIFLYISLALSPLFPLIFNYITISSKLGTIEGILVYLLIILIFLGILLIIFINVDKIKFNKSKKNSK